MPPCRGVCRHWRPPKPTWQHPAALQQGLQQRAQRAVCRQLLQPSGRSAAAAAGSGAGEAPAALHSVAEGGEGRGAAATGARVSVLQREALQGGHCGNMKKAGGGGCTPKCGALHRPAWTGRKGRRGELCG